MLDIQSQATEPGLPLMLRRSLDAASGRLGLLLQDISSPDLPDVLVTLHPIVQQTVVVDRASEDAVSATAYEVTVSLEAQCGDQSTDISAPSAYRDRFDPLTTDEARRDAIARAASVLADELAAWVVARCLQAHIR